MAVRQRAVLGDEVTYVVLDRKWRVVEPVEAYLETGSRKHAKASGPS